MIDSTGELSFWERRESVMAAKATPANSAMASPATLPPRRPSARNSAMPPSTRKTAVQSARVARSPRNQAPNNAIHTGAVYCSRIALAAVVSLVATQNAMVQTA